MCAGSRRGNRHNDFIRDSDHDLDLDLDHDRDLHCNFDDHAACCSSSCNAYSDCFGDATCCHFDFFDNFSLVSHATCRHDYLDCFDNFSIFGYAACRHDYLDCLDNFSVVGYAACRSNTAGHYLFDLNAIHHIDFDFHPPYGYGYSIYYFHPSACSGPYNSYHDFHSPCGYDYSIYYFYSSSCPGPYNSYYDFHSPSHNPHDDFHTSSCDASSSYSDADLNDDLSQYAYFDLNFHDDLYPRRDYFASGYIYYICRCFDYPD